MRLALVSLLVLVTLLVVAVAPPARADWAPSSGARPATDGFMWEEVDIATRYWAAHGVTGCADGITANYATKLSAEDGSGSDAVGRGADCEIWVLASLKKWRSPKIIAPSRASLECTVVMHEVGHALGLEHTATGVMAPSVSEDPKTHPRECRVWGRRFRGFDR